MKKQITIFMASLFVAMFGIMPVLHAQKVGDEIPGEGGKWVVVAVDSSEVIAEHERYEAKYDELDRISFGVLAGAHLNWTLYKNNMVPGTRTGADYNAAFFFEFVLGPRRIFSIRPEVDILKRDARLKDFNMDGTDLGLFKGEYKMDVKMFDARLPFIFNLGNHKKIHPYIYIAPVAGFAYGGTIQLIPDEGEKAEVDVNGSNFRNYYIAGQLGVGVKFPIYFKSNPRKHLDILLEVNAEGGITDTYSKKENDGKAEVVRPDGKYYDGKQPLYADYDAKRRNFVGLEARAGLSFPLSLFQGREKKVTPRVERAWQPKPDTVIVHTVDTIVKHTVDTIVIEKVRKDTVIMVTKPCYSLDEIIEMLEKGQSIAGLSFCSVNDITFEFDKADIKPESYPYLNKIADLMKRTEAKIIIGGHTDNKGSAAYNLKLSERRAKAVYDYLIGQGVIKENLAYDFFGLSRPRATNETEEGRQQNRRVEFEILNANVNQK